MSSKNTKSKEFFLNLGKKHKIFLPIAIFGLWILMISDRFTSYVRRECVRFICVCFILCLFFVGNSFAFPRFNVNNGFISDSKKETPIEVEESTISLSSEFSINVDEDDNYSLLNEDGELEEYNDDIFSLDDILVNRSLKNDSNFADDARIEKSFNKDDWNLILINKQHPIPDNYEFTLGRLSGYMQCDERIIDDLLNMMNDAKKENVSLLICSPYRDLEKQQKLFDRKIDNYMHNGYSYIEAYKLSSQAVTIPGASEHQVGLALDLVTEDYTVLDEGFENTDAGIWLKNNCDKYGFILRYPKGKEYITSIEYEPWHFRYVGKDAAKIIMQNGLCLEEFWDKYL